MTVRLKYELAMDAGSYEFPVETFSKALGKKGFGTPEMISCVGRFPPMRAWNDTNVWVRGRTEGQRGLHLG
jgi:hypothetical protein